MNFKVEVKLIKEKFIRKVKILTGGVNGVASQAEIVRAFGVSKISVKRYVKCYRKVGSNGFFSPRRTRSAAVLTPEVLREVQKLLDAGEEVSRICQEIGLKTNTVNKAIRDGRLQREKKHPKHIVFAQLPQEEKFQKLATNKKHFIDTIKMIAYRAETALANIIRPKMVRRDEARSVIRQIFSKDVNLKPDKANKRLTIELHNLTNEYEDKLGQIICDTLNETGTTFPGTDMEIFYKLVSEKNRRSQEVCKFYFKIKL